MTDFNGLVTGYQRFHTGNWAREKARWSELAEGQDPKVMVFACSDSRVDPAQVFDTVPGEIFVVRNVANLVPPYEPDGKRHGVSAALEYAVTQLEVPEIVVMGHESCGGVGACLGHAFEDADPGEGGFIRNWVEMIDQARDKVVAEHGDGDEGRRELELETVRLSLRNLMSFPFVKERVEAGTLTLHGTYFAIRDGVLHVLGNDGKFAAA